MLENEPTPENNIEGLDKEPTKEELFGMAQELCNIKEPLPFNGINQYFYNELKAQYNPELREEYPDFAPEDIDVLITRFQNEGIKIVSGGDPKTGELFVLPFSSNNIRQHSIRISNLNVVDDMNDLLKTVISNHKTITRGYNK